MEIIEPKTKRLRRSSKSSKSLIKLGQSPTIEITESKELEQSIRNSNERDWTSLPDLVLHSILSRFNSMADLGSLSAVCKSWHSVATYSYDHDALSCQSPLLLFTEAKTLSQHLFDISEEGLYETPLPWRVDSRSSISYSHGYLLTVNGTRNNNARILLYNIFSGAHIRLPPIPKSRTWKWNSVRAILSASPSSADCSLVVFSPKSSHVAFYHMGSTKPKWKVHSVEDDNPIEDMIFFKGKLYALLVDGNLFNMDFSDQNMEVSNVGLDVSMKELKEMCSEYTDWMLATTDVELLLICFCRGCTDIAMYKWDFGGKNWVDTVSVGSKALFVGTNGFGACVEPNGLSIKHNCVYYVDCNNNTWYEFSYNEQKVVVTQLGDDMLLRKGKDSPAIWVLPSTY